MALSALFGTNNKDKAVAFYDAVLGELGAKRAFTLELAQYWSLPDGPMIGVGTPRNGNPATNGNGSQITISVSDKSMVDRAYNKAIELGGTCEGKPGPRGETFYGAYFRDLDGNKFCVGKMG